VFRPGEVTSLLSQMSLFEQPYRGGGKKGRAAKKLQRNDNKDEGQLREGGGVKETGNTAMNDMQKKAVEHYKGACLVLSGPGTGKTFVLTKRITGLIKERGVSPENILAVTFTNKAAEEMQKRIARDLGNEKTAGQVTVTTFHSFGMSVLRRYASFFGRSPEFLIFEEKEKFDALQSSVNVKEKELKRILNAISLAKNRMQRPEDVEHELATAYKAYEEMLGAANAFDLDDLVFYAARLLEECKDAAKEIRETFTWLCIDEYQDINNSQYRLIRLLCPDDNSNIFAIGDPNQAIYGFRGADAHFIQRFKDDYPSATVFRLSKSYRCPDRILRASAQVVSPDGEGEFLTGLAGDVSVHIEPCSTEKSEAEFVARTIERMIGGVRFFSIDSNISDGSERDQPLSFSDFAVLFRISKMAPNIIKALNDHGIPFQIIGEEPFYRNEPISTIIDVLKCIESPRHDLIVRRLKGKNIDEKSLESIMKGGIDREACTLGDLITNIVNDYLPEITKSHGDGIENLISMADTCDNNLSLFLSRLSLGSPVDTYNKSAEQVTLMTIHASKGLEFPCVFIIGCEDGILPFTLLGRDGCNREEERKLLYVGMTRAKAALFLSHADKRRLYNRYFELTQSPFLHSIKEELIERGEKKIRRRGLRDRQLSLFP
ncbi:MAG: ATP-dependent helicase, partial [Deltaproteobacteria bacterium]|nr:ATP-dependent helicase [Deltaproteobacteria bacterium]